MQFWKKSRDNKAETMQVYNELCKAGGSKPFLSLLRIADLENPFIDGTIKKTLEPVMEYINSVDNQSL